MLSWSKKTFKPGADTDFYQRGFDESRPSKPLEGGSGGIFPWKISSRRKPFLKLNAILFASKKKRNLHKNDPNLPLQKFDKNVLHFLFLSILWFAKDEINKAHSSEVSFRILLLGIRIAFSISDRCNE